MSITDYQVTDHAYSEMARRQITEAQVVEVLHTPEQIETVRVGRVVYQSRFESGEPRKTYLLRVFIDIDRDPPAVVTVYRTSKIAKYWKVAP